MSEADDHVINGWIVERLKDGRLMSVALNVRHGEFVEPLLATLFPTEHVARIYAEEFGFRNGKDVYIRRGGF